MSADKLCISMKKKADDIDSGWEDDGNSFDAVESIDDEKNN